MVLIKGIITSGQYLTSNGKTYTHYYGRNEDLTKLHIIVEHNPYFGAEFDYPKQHDAMKHHNNVRSIKAEGTTLKGKSIYTINVDFPFNVPTVKRQMKQTYESDIPFTFRVLADAGVKFGVEYDPTVEVHTIDTLSPCEVDIDPVVTVIDIENIEQKIIDPTNPDTPIISVCFLLGKKCFVITTAKVDKKKVIKVLHKKTDELKAPRFDGFLNIIQVKNEKQIFLKYKQLLEKYQPDIITGWNVRKYDKTFIEYRSEKVHVLKPEHRHSAWIDMMETYDIFTRNQTPHGLDYCSKKTLGYGKIDRGETIKSLYENNQELLIAYNIWDCLLVQRIEKVKTMIPSVISLCKEVGRLIEELYPNLNIKNINKPPPKKHSFANSHIVDGHLIHLMNEIYSSKGKVYLPTKAYDQKSDRKSKDYSGGLVLTPSKGLFKWVAFFDFRAEYPTIMRSGNISPDTFTFKPIKGREYYCIENTDPKYPHTSYYLKKPKGLIPYALEKLDNQRQAIKDLMKKYDKKSPEYKALDSIQWAIKIVMNAYYGILSSSFYRLSERAIGSDVTFIAREHNKWQSKKIKEFYEMKGLNTENIILSGDTDAQAIGIPADTIEEAIEFGKELDEYLNKSFDEFAKRWGWDTHYLQTKFEKLYYNWNQSAYEVTIKGKKEIKGKKQYFGFICYDGNKIYDITKATRDDIDITGYGGKKADSSQMKTDIQKDLFFMISTHPHDKDISELREKISEYIYKIQNDFFEGKMNVQLFLKSKIVDHVSTYKTLGPHVKSFINTRTLDEKSVNYGDEFKWCYIEPMQIVEGEPKIDCIGLKSERFEDNIHDFIKKNGIKIDYMRMWKRNVTTPLVHVFESLGFSKKEIEEFDIIKDKGHWFV